MTSEKVLSDGETKHSGLSRKLASMRNARSKAKASPGYIKDQWYELIGSPGTHKKGRKILMFTKTEVGTSSSYCGREKDKLSFLRQLKKEGKIRPARARSASPDPIDQF